MAVVMVAGSFMLFCGQQMLGGGDGDGGMVSPADAQQSGGGTCCTPPARPSPDVLFDDVTTAGKTAEIDISAYNLVVVHIEMCSAYTASYRFGSAGFVNSGPVFCRPSVAGGQPSGSQVFTADPRLGNALRVDVSGGGQPHVTIVGHK
jgi:hypothetical protein